jgi:hypothetical protein
MELPLGDTAIERICMEFGLWAAPLDAILADIAWEETVHTALAPPMTPSGHPTAMLSYPPHPMSYVGPVLATMGGSPDLSLPPALAPSALQLPTINDQLQMVCQHAQPHHPTGRCHHP